ncbi:transmembrane protein 255B isoform X1 [Hemiscyllium ocellatum]|uniref:transmembrane protein 255B isoform X1 n=2 Tax=Hemiscyllium ocellatum TaxID=170820 RepID=UPI002965DAE6|nr:transmembrane protein 255B isoform X1 [Hemiscyllium ocellatum]
MQQTQLRFHLLELLMKRKKRAVWLSSILLLLSLVITAVGIFTETRTENISIIGYASGIILAFGSFLGLLGLFLDENRKQLLIAAITFLSFGIIGAFICVIVDGVFTAVSIDLRPLRAGRCQYYTSGQNFIYDNYLATVPCQTFTESCNLKVRSNTCYCCELYNCANGDYLKNYFEFVGVKSCQEIQSLYIMIWLVTTLNISAFILGIATSAILGNFKNTESLIAPDVSVQLFNFHNSRCNAKEETQSQPSTSPSAPLLLQEQGVDIAQQRPSVCYMSMPAATSLPCYNHSHTKMDNNPPPFAPLYNFLPEKPLGYPI